MTSSSSLGFRAQLAAAGNVWELALFLADWSGDGHPLDDEWSGLNQEARSWWDDSERDQVDDSHRERIIDLTDDGMDRAAANAIAWAIDHRCWPLFARHWRLSRCPDGIGRVELGHGDPFPVSDLELDRYKDVFELQDLTSRGSAKHKTTPAELPHLRRFNSGVYAAQVLVDFSFDFELQAVLDPLGRVFLFQLNEALKELDIPSKVDRYPIRVHDEDDQLTRILTLLDQLPSEVPALVVLPELSVTERIVGEVQAHLDRDSFADVLVIAGSRHVDEGPTRRNFSDGLMPGVSNRLEHRKLVPFTHLLSEREQYVEAIDASSELVIYTAGVCRFATLICKDFLEPDLVRLVEHLGVNVLAVPAMSELTKPDFNARAASFVQASQGFCAVVNGPYLWNGAVDPSALIGQPLKTADVVEWNWPHGAWGGPAGICYAPGAGFSIDSTAEESH